MTITFMNTGEEMNETEKLPTSLVQNTTQGSLLCCSQSRAAQWTLKLNGPFDVWQMHFIWLPRSHAYKCILVMVCMFLPKPSLADRLLSLPWLMSFWKKGHTYLGHSYLISVGTHFTGWVLQQVLQLVEVCTVWLIWQHSVDYCPQSSGSGKCTKDINTQWATFLQVFQPTWPKALLLVLLNLRSTPLETH